MNNSANILILSILLIFSCSNDDSNNSNNDNASSGLVAYFPLDGDFDDYSGNGYHSSGNSQMNFGTDVMGNQNKAASFVDGSFFDVENNDDLDFGSGDFSISLWINTENDAEQVVFQKGEHFPQDDQTQSSLVINHSSSGTKFLTKGNSGGDGVFTSSNAYALNDGSWHHIVVTRAFQTLKLHIDNQPPTTQYGSLQNVSNISDLTFGADLFYDLENHNLELTKQFIGLMDEVRIYNKALSDEEIQDLYNYLN